MPEKLSINTKEELHQMLKRISDENEALQRLIAALKKQNKTIIDKILNKSNQ